jgi:hypothetical protein
MRSVLALIVSPSHQRETEAFTAYGWTSSTVEQ